MHGIMSDQPRTAENCSCESLPDLAVVPMGGDGLHERVFASLDPVLEHGSDQWWLYVSVCTKCGQNWMIAQDDRIYDNFYLRRLDPATVDAIQRHGQWPAEFITYERVLSLGRAMSKPWTFLDPRSPALVWTAEDLRRERSDISVGEISYLLGIPEPDARRLFRKATLIDRFRAWVTRG